MFVQRASHVFRCNSKFCILLLNRKSSDYNSRIKHSIPYGGLDKAQGGIKEETYFSKQESELIKNMQENPEKIVCQITRDGIDCNTAVPESYFAYTKGKNSKEEAFFYNETLETIRSIKNNE